MCIYVLCFVSSCFSVKYIEVVAWSVIFFIFYFFNVFNLRLKFHWETLPGRNHEIFRFIDFLGLFLLVQQCKRVCVCKDVVTFLCIWILFGSMWAGCMMCFLNIKNIIKIIMKYLKLFVHSLPCYIEVCWQVVQRLNFTSHLFGL